MPSSRRPHASAPPRKSVHALRPVGAVLFTCILAAALAACDDGQAEGAPAPLDRAGTNPAGSDPADPAGSPQSAQEGVMGTLQTSLDGQDHTWYIVRGEGVRGAYSSGTWMVGSDGDLIVSLSGLDSDAPPIHTFVVDLEAGEMSLGDYRGSSFSLTVPIPARGGSRSFTFPADDDSGASIVYTPDAAAIADGIDMTNLFSLVEGEIQVTAAERTGESMTLRGTFSGTLEAMEGGRRIEAAEGRFAAETIPSLQSLQGHRSP